MKIFHGANLLPEGLEFGEVQVNGTAEFDELEPINIIAYSGDKFPGSISGEIAIDINQGGYVVNGIASSVCFILVENENYNLVMNNLQNETYSDYIIACFTVPKIAVKDFMTLENKLTGIPAYILQRGKNYNQTATQKTLISTPTNLDSYSPRNQKLRTYPYLYLGFNPNNGSSKVYRYEDFANGTPQFNIICEVNPNPTIVFIPLNYRGQTGESLSDIATLNGYPTLSSRNDYYNSWLAQNSEIISLQMQQENFNYQIGQINNALGTAAGIIGNATTGNVGGLISGAVSGVTTGISNSINHDFYIKQQMAQVEKQALLPDKVNLAGSNATLIGYGMQDKNIFTRYNIKREFAERIDKYFDMYGYLTNTVKVPNINNRPNWNYVKTIGANILGNIPEDDLYQIRQFFDNGITLWHNTNTFLDYSQNNR